jgi:hypothetical protein
MSSPAIRRATTKSSASQPRFGLVMHPRRVFPLFATDPCFAALGRCAPVSLILPGLAELYFQSNDRLPVKTMSILNSWPSSKEQLELRSPLARAKTLSGPEIVPMKMLAALL